MTEPVAGLRLKYVKMRKIQPLTNLIVLNLHSSATFTGTPVQWHVTTNSQSNGRNSGNLLKTTW